MYKGTRQRLAISPASNAQFVVDAEYEVRFASGTDKSGKTKKHYRKDHQSQWQPLQTLPGFNQDSTPLRFLCDTQTVLVWDHNGSGVGGYYTINLASGEKKEIFQHEEIEPSTIVLDEQACKIAAVEYHPDYPAYKFINKEHSMSKALQAALKQFSGRHVHITSSSTDGTKSVMYVYSDSDPGAFYLWEHDANKVTLISARSTGKFPRPEVETIPFKIKASDELTLHGYISTPKNSPPKNLPLVVVPHGGPYYVRHFWGYSRERHILVSQGFAVLEVNFRGSGGYGKTFEAAAYKQWGSRVQQDIIEATQWIVKQGFADPARICIYGASFGAYSAMQSAILAPDLFQCVAGYAGVYDLTIMDAEGDIQRRSWGSEYIEKSLGSDEAQLVRFSPAKRANEIRIPVFLAHGEKDQRAPMAHAIAMKKAIASSGQPCQWMVKPGEGHGFQDKQNRLEFYVRLLDFLVDHTRQQTVDR